MAETQITITKARTCEGCGGFGSYHSIVWDREIACEKCGGKGKTIEVDFFAVVVTNDMWRPSDGCDFAAIDAAAQRDRNHVLMARRDWKRGGATCCCDVCKANPNVVPSPTERYLVALANAGQD